MNDRPSATELLAAVERFLEEQVVPTLEGPARFHARVAANVIRIVARELETEEAQLVGEWRRLAVLLGSDPTPPASRAVLREQLRSRNQELVRRIRAGEADGPWREAVIDHLTQTVSDKLDVAQPPRRRPPETEPAGR